MLWIFQLEISVGYPKENFWIEPILAEFGNM